MIKANLFYLVPHSEGFQLWNGYVESESNFHYCRFSGFQVDGSECWILERSDIQDVIIPVTFVQARELIESHKPMCSQCRKHPAYRRGTRLFALCAGCGLDAIQETILAIDDREDA